MSISGTTALHALADTAIGWWRSWRSARSNLAQLQQCGRDEAERIAHDSGLSAHDLRMTAAEWPDAADLLSHRLHAIGLSTEVASAERAALRDLQRTCSICQSKRICGRDLVRGEHDAGWQAYCPNASTLDALRMEAELRRLEYRKAHAHRSLPEK